MRKRACRKAALLLAAVLAASSAGCFGKFQLTRTLYDINRSVEDQYVRSAVTWAFVIPYGFASFIDFAVFNVVEFWTGENPMEATRTARRGNETAVMRLGREGAATTATIDRYRDGRLVSTLILRDGGNGVVRSSLVEGGVETVAATATLLPDGGVEVARRTAAGTLRERHGAPAVDVAAARFGAPPAAAPARRAPGLRG